MEKYLPSPPLPLLLLWSDVTRQKYCDWSAIELYLRSIIDKERKRERGRLESRFLFLFFLLWFVRGLEERGWRISYFRGRWAATSVPGISCDAWTKVECGSSWGKILSWGWLGSTLGGDIWGDARFLISRTAVELLRGEALLSFPPRYHGSMNFYMFFFFFFSGIEFEFGLVEWFHGHICRF